MMTNERCRLISESQWREYQELVTKCHRLEQQLESETLAKQEGVEIVAELEDRLKEANKTLMYVAAMMTCDPADMLETYPDFCADQWALDAINKYLEKYGVKND